MNSDEIALRSQIIRVLTSGPIWKMDFSLGPVHVDGRGFFSVVWALTWGKIGVRIDNTSVAGAGAEYHPKDDEYVFPFKAAAMTHDQKMLLVHESVHAMNDIRAGRPYPRTALLEVENEAAAYVAQALYGILAFDSHTGFKNSYLYDTAFEIANKIKDTKGANVEPADAKKMTHAVAMHPSYFRRILESTPAPADGVW